MVKTHNYIPCIIKIANQVLKNMQNKNKVYTKRDKLKKYLWASYDLSSKQQTKRLKYDILAFCMKSTYKEAKFNLIKQQKCFAKHHRLLKNPHK